MKPALTARDHALLSFLAQHKAAPLDVVASRFFTQNPQAGGQNRQPQRAAARRLETLAAAGFIAAHTVRTRPGRQVAKTFHLLPKGARLLSTSRPGAFPSKGRDHHVATMRIVEVLRTRLETEGAHVDFQLEFAIRSAQQGGRATRRGQTYDSFPDALVVVERIDASGQSSRATLAVEYVTSKYTDAMIREKASSFARYDDVVWVADTTATRARVEKLTGASCSLLP